MLNCLRIKIGVKYFTRKPFLVTRFIITGDLKAAIALAAVIASEPPKYKYVDLIRSLTYCGQILQQTETVDTNHFGRE